MKLRKLLLGGVVLAASTSIPSQAQITDRVRFTIPPIAIVWSGDGAGTATVYDLLIGTGGPNANRDRISASGATVITGTLTTSNGDISDGFGRTEDPTGTPPTGVVDITDATFELTDQTTLTGGDVQSSFFVASNAGFNIAATVAQTNTVANPDFNDPADPGFDPLLPVDTEEFLDATSGLRLSDISFAFDVTGGAAARQDADGNDVAGIPTNTGDNSAAPTNGIAAPADLSLISQDTTAPTDIFQGSGATAAAPGSISSQSVRFDATYGLGGQALDLSSGAGSIEADVTFTVYLP